MKIAIIDYSIGNLFSVVQACKAVGLEPAVLDGPDRLPFYDGAILPGVGAFAQGIENLHAAGFVAPLLSHIRAGKPTFGICLGMQLLFERSDELKPADGLGVLRGRVRSLRGALTQELPVPQIMWNRALDTHEKWADSPLQGVPAGSYFYFAHSYYCDAGAEETVATTSYGNFAYSSCVQQDNVFATQFHPEKSGAVGLKVYENWKASISH